ncbi:DNA repair protein RecO [Candidatus Roizmanbacteria bacterium RIFCSPHIGHO2_02_FULL_37_13b]|uniref:DNA repair protein RecO n=1 Tax=Candidatus Roizmanbacteria bacterium RIFCSPLOWO2_02_FULL_36_11 TaxID=1802071 RepID=A0A1F7JCQ4_9BACT|nr:MAG: DNA repair protein RecO [Candidatus Roizmanbacteria bacterium RIFCSPHIGHO2_02_FULL_37_13b]OGK53394.1 MAG: DNA repair protein RecO [Candidatus Roizmanbacteria bacterium RIFCSPLOWO2_02_FULL_36_11]
MRQFVRDEGIVIRKRGNFKENRIITIISKQSGKLNLLGYGVRNLLSRRISHLETGNYISFTYNINNNRTVLHETNLLYGYSKIKKDESKLGLLFLLFFILDKMIVENQKEEIIFNKTVVLLRQLNNRKDFGMTDFNDYLCQLLLHSGFIDKKRILSANFNPVVFIEDLIGSKLKWAFVS